MATLPEPAEEVGAFLIDRAPFNRLPAEVVAETARAVEIAIFPRDRVILATRGEPARHLYVIRSGAVDLLRDDSAAPDIVDTLGVGDTFAHPSLISGRAPILSARAREETRAYLIPRAQFERLRTYAAFEAHFVAGLWERLERALRLSRERAPLDLFGTRCGALLRRPPVFCRPDEPIRLAAQRMAAEGVSSIVVQTEPLGILTDRDLRNRVLGAGLSPDASVLTAMSQPTITLPTDSLLFEALLLMVERSIHHLPLTQGGRVVGIITDSDILRHQSGSPVFLRRQLDRARTDADFADYSRLVNDTVNALLGAGARASDVCRVVGVAHDALIRRLLGDIEGELGPPPVPYAFVVLGSEARQEQALRTRQQHALTWQLQPGADGAERAAVAAYFAGLGERISTRLAAAGFPPSADRLMSSQPDWRLPLSDWQERDRQWVDRPDAKVLPRIARSLDRRPVYGGLQHTDLTPTISAEPDRSRRFLTLLARAALAQRPPLGFFRQFALGRGGALDLRLRGVGPVVRLARLLALAGGSHEVNTVARLRAAAGTGLLAADEAAELVAAFELMSLIRLRHQVAQSRPGEAPSNDIRPADLSDGTRRDLRAAFLAVEAAQRTIEQRFPNTMLG